MQLASCMVVTPCAAAVLPLDGIAGYADDVRMSVTPEVRRLAKQKAAHTRWSREDPKPALAKVREGRTRKYENQVDPDRILPEAERQRRAESAFKADMAGLALKSAQARKRRKQPP